MRVFKKINISFSVFLAVALLICALATVLSVRDIQHSSYLERAKSLNVVMSKIGGHLNVAFDTKWHRIQSLSSRIARLSADSVEDLIRVLDDIYEETGVDFKVVDDNGIAYYHDGMQEYWKDHKAVPFQEEGFILSSLQFGVTNENYMKYIEPLQEPLVIGDTRIIYTVLTEPLSDLHKDFDTGDFGEGCLSFIVDKNGTFIYENGSDDPMADCYNFLAYLEKTVTFQYGETFEHFKANIQNGISNTVLVAYNGSYYYLCHFDLDMENWTSILLIPEQNTQAEARSFTQKLLGNLAFVFGTAFLLFIIGFLYMWKNTVTKQRMAAEAEKRSNEAKTNFLSSMSHDIRTPMNAIIGMAEIALRSREDIPQPVQENLENIRLSSAHMLMLINDILDISKIESGRMTLNIAEFSIVDSTNTLANLIRPLAKSKNIDLRIHTYNYRQEYLLGDELRFSQVCINLATNAIKYTPNGGSVVIDFKQDFPDDLPNKVQMTCVVRDTGIGMSADYQKVMYEIFTRATDSRVNKVAGSGLGLPICKQIVEMMGGTLVCESAPDRGTTFTVTVTLEKSKPDEVYTLPHTRILVVDRDAISTDALACILKRLQVEADIIHDPAALTDTLAQGPAYQAAFVELSVPESAGLCTARALRAHFGADFPIILTDISDLVEYAAQIAAAGVSLTMNKPYFYRTVYLALRKALNHRWPDSTAQKDRKTQLLSGMQVLVAEDNDLNWVIVQKLLELNGVSAQRAENGRICVDMLNAAEVNQYAAVLMDVRMPVMDGLEATRIIRSAENRRLRTIPIIAMTADAFSEDIQHCLDAGMDGHLSKPINFERLLSVLSALPDWTASEAQHPAQTGS